MATPLTEEELARLEGLHAKATRGFWQHYSAPLRAAFPTPIIEIQDANGKPIVQWAGFDHDERAVKKNANAAFIVAAKNAFPRLLATIRSLLSENKALREAHVDNAVAAAVALEVLGTEDGALAVSLFSIHRTAASAVQAKPTPRAPPHAWW